MFVVALTTLVVGGVVLAGGFAALGPDKPRAAPPSSQAPLTTSEEQPSPHHYVAIVRGYFGYSAGLSDNDRAMGIASKPLTLVGYQGKQGSQYSFSISDGGPYVEILTCSEPCEVAQTMGMNGNRVFQVQPGTVLGEIIDDARNGQLDAAPNAASQAPADVPRTEEPAPPEPRISPEPHHLPKYGIQASEPST